MYTYLSLSLSIYIYIHIHIIHETNQCLFGSSEVQLIFGVGYLTYTSWKLSAVLVGVWGRLYNDSYTNDLIILLVVIIVIMIIIILVVIL